MGKVGKVGEVGKVGKVGKAGEVLVAGWARSATHDDSKSPKSMTERPLTHER